MALVVADRVKETSTTQGTGAFTLAGASTGFQSFAVIGNGNQTYYTIAEQGGSNWEVGIGTYNSSGTTLTRNVVLSSTNAGSLVAFGPGTKDVFVTYPAERAVYGDTASVIQYTSIDADSIDVNSRLSVTGVVTVVGALTADTITSTSLFNVANNLTAQRLTAADSTSNVTLIYGDAYSVSGSAGVPMVDMSGIWNTTGEPTLVKYNVTNNASGTNSLLLDLQTGGTSRFKVDKNGAVTAASSIFGGGAVSISGGFTGTTGTFTTGTITNLTATNETVTSLTATAETVTSLTVTNETVSTITGATNSFCDMDTIQGDILIATATPANTQIFFSDSGSISGSSAVALFDIAATWNTTGSPTGFKLNVADSASDTLSSFIDLQRNGSSQFKINKFGGLNTKSILQAASVSVSSAPATTNYDVISQLVQYYQGTLASDFTLNFRGNSSISLNSYMAVGQTVDVILLVTNGATPYVPDTIQVDGATAGVSVYWLGGTLPTGNASSIDIYTFSIFKTAAATFSVFGSVEAFASAVPLPPTVIGQAYGGGFYAGQISTAGTGVADYYLIVAPKSTGETVAAFKTSATADSGTLSDVDGPANTAAVNDASHPAVQFCTGLSIGGYTDWYMPAFLESQILYANLRPVSSGFYTNDTTTGINPYSVPPRATNFNNVGTGDPSQTTAAAFQVSQAEYFDNYHWTSTENPYNYTQQLGIGFFNGTPYPTGGKYPITKNYNARVRAIRRVPV